MNRDEKILSFTDMVDFIVRKYNNGCSDEDLHSIGMIGIIKCVDDCYDKAIDNYDDIKKRCYISARNAILTEKYKPKIKSVENSEYYFDTIEDREDDSLVVLSLKESLTPRQNEIFDLLYAGYSVDEICEKLEIQQSRVYSLMAEIKKKLTLGV